MLIDDLVAVSDIAEKFGRSVKTLKNWSASPTMRFPKAVRVGGRLYLSTVEVDRWFAALKGQPLPPEETVQIIPPAKRAGGRRHV